MLTRGIEVMKYVRASAGRAGLSVVFENVNQPRHDGNTIYLPRITNKTTERDLQQLMASTDHEVAHDRFSSFDVLKEVKMTPNSLLQLTWNFLEDSRVNTIEAMEYKGFKENWDDCSAEYIVKIVSRPAETLIAKVMTALICWETKISESTFPLCQAATLTATPDAEFMDVLSNFSDRLVRCHNILDKKVGTQATYDLAKDILEALGEECKENIKKVLAEAAAAKAEDSRGKKTKKSKEGDKGSATSGETASEDKGDSDKGPTDEDYKIVKLELTKEDMEKYSMSPAESHAMSKVGSSFEPVDQDTSCWELTDFSKFVVYDYPKAKGPSRYAPVASYFIPEYNVRVGMNLVKQENFAQQVRKLIQIRARVQTQYGVKKGKLDQSRLSRVCFKAPGLSEKIFKRRIENKTLDAAITVLVDMSGSMGGIKVFQALASTLLISEVCTTLNIPLEIIGFTDDGHELPLMFIYKSFADLHVAPESLKEYFAASSNWMSGNPDGENILWAYDRLLKRKERKRLMIVMSDGSPAASKYSIGVEEFTLRAIREIESAKKVDIYGLGLCSTSVQSYYKANSVVSKPEEIPTKLLNLIEQRIINNV